MGYKPLVSAGIVKSDAHWAVMGLNAKLYQKPCYKMSDTNISCQTWLSCILSAPEAPALLRCSIPLAWGNVKRGCRLQPAGLHLRYLHS